MHVATQSNYYSVSHDGRTAFTEVISKFDVPVHVSRFTASGPVRIRVEVPRHVHSVYVGPESLSIDVGTSDRSVEFTIPGPGHFVVRINELGYLFLFAERDERDRHGELASRARRVEEFDITPGGDGPLTGQIQNAIDTVSMDPEHDYLVFPAGRYETGSVELRSNVTLFLEEDAFLVGSDDPVDYPDQSWMNGRGEWSHAHSLIVANGVENAGIAGNGVIDGNGKSLKLQGLGANLLRIRESRNVRITGVQLRDPSGWNTHILASDNILMRDVKVINNVPYVNWTNTDGIDPDCSSDVTIESTFMYCGDDCIAIKAKSHNREFSRNTERITVRRSLCISACAALKIGTETVADSIRDVLFEDNDIIFARRALVIDALDRSRIGGVTFRDIRIETLNDGPGIHRPRLIEFQISSEAFRPCEGTCSIADVLVENVSSSSLYPSRIIGRTQEHGIRRVTIRALTIQGRSITNSADAALETNEFVAELVFEQA